MLDGAFFIFMAVTVLTYGIQGSVQTLYVRKYDALSVALYRNLSLGFTMLPVLYVVPFSDVLKISEHLGVLFLASVTGAISLLCALTSSRYLPLGIGTALRQLTQVFVAVLLGVLILNEFVSMIQILILGGIVTCGIVLTLLRSHENHLNPSTVSKGIGLTILAGISVACSFFFLSVLAREVHPFVAGYFWEFGIGICALAYFLFMRYARGLKLSSMPAKDKLSIIVISLLTIFGTTAYASAVNHGPYALANGLLTTTVIVATMMGWVLYRERLTKAQSVLIAIAVLLMILMRLVS